MRKQQQRARTAEDEARAVVADLRHELSYSLNLERAVATLDPDERRVLRAVVRTAKSTRAPRLEELGLS